MKKLLVALVIAAALAASPLLVGKIAQGQFSNTLAQVDEIDGYEVAITKRKGGYLSSHYTVRVGMDLALLTQDPQLQNLDPEEQEVFDQIKDGVLVDVEMQHGPIVLQPNFVVALYRAQTQLADGQEFVERGKRFLNVDELFTATEEMGLFGKGKLRVSVPEFQIVDVSGRVDFGGMEINSDLSRYGKAYTINGTIGQLILHNPELQLTMEPATITGKGEIANFGDVGLGDLTLTFPRFTVSGQVNVVTEDFVLAASVTEPKPEALSVDYRINIARVAGDMLPQTYTDIDMHIVLENINKTTVQRYTEAVYSGTVDTEDPDEVFAMVNELLASSPKFVIKNIGYSADNAVQLSVAGDIGVDNSLLDGPLTMENAQSIVPAVIANLELRAHRDLVNTGIELYSQQQTQAMIVQLDLSPEEAMDMQSQQLMQWQGMLNDAMADGMIMDQGETLYLKASFSQGNLTVNDKPLQM